MSQDPQIPPEHAAPDAAGPAASSYECPRCGALVQAEPGPVARVLACPACGEHLVIPAADGSTDVPDESEAVREEIAQTKEAELDGLRMRNVVALRRTAIRSRSYAVIGAVGCAVAAVKLASMTATELWEGGWFILPPGEAWAAGGHVRLIAFPVLALLAVWGVDRCIRRAAHWGRESKATVLPEPEAPPDFSTLSDGSQHAKHLEEIR